MNESAATLTATQTPSQARLPRQVPYIIANEACELLYPALRRLGVEPTARRYPVQDFYRA